MSTPFTARTTLAFSSALLVVACTKAPAADAYGNFEAEEVVVAAETGGQLKSFVPAEGQRVEANAHVGQVDTLQLAFERDQLVAQRAGALDHKQEAVQQIKALDVQLDIATRARERIDRLFANQAATAQQRDQQEREVRVLREQITGARATLSRSGSDIASLDARIAGVQDRIRRASLTSPVTGTVLATYVRTGEIIQPGQALYRVANLDTLVFRAYVTGGQLSAFKLGQSVQVHADQGDKTLRNYAGTVSWVSSRAEFTPTPVQTRDDRADLVYAVKVRVANTDGALKIGMPGDVGLVAAQVAAKPASTP
jgi:HlyD family secretion protein